jgi:hypothetical protein
MDPVVIEPIMQKDIADCAVAALAMYLGLSYQHVFSVIPKRAHVGSEGLSRRQRQHVARKCGWRLKAKAAVDEDDIGLLELERPDKSARHIAVYAKGTIYDPACGLWFTDLDAYLRERNWTIVGLEWREKIE